MIEEELVNLVAEHIYNNYYRDTETGIKTLEFCDLRDDIKQKYCSMATNIITIINDWYDLEWEKELEGDLDDEELIEEDPYSNHNLEDWWEF